MLAGRKNEQLGHNLASYGSRTSRKQLIYQSSLYLQRILLKKRIEGPLCPGFYGSNLSTGNLWEMHGKCALCSLVRKTNCSGLTSPEMALGHNGNYICVYLGYVFNVVHKKKRIEGMLRLVSYLPVPAGRFQSDDRYPPKCAPCL